MSHVLWKIAGAIHLHEPLELMAILVLYFSVPPPSLSLSSALSANRTLC